MVKVTKDRSNDLYVGALVRYTGVLAEDNTATSDVLLVDDLIHITEVPEDLEKGWIRGVVVERKGAAPDDNIEDYFQCVEVDPMGNYLEWLSAQSGDEVSDADCDVEDAAPIKRKSKKPATKSKKKSPKVDAVSDTPNEEATTSTNELTVYEEKQKDTGVLVDKGTNDLMTYLNRTNMHQAALDLASINHMSDAVLAKVLTNIYDNKVYMGYISKDDGEETNFLNYIETYFTNTVNYRKAMYLISTCKFLESEGMDELEVVDYITKNGYAKIQKLMSLRKYLNTDDGQALLDRDPNIMKDMFARAESVGRDRLQEEIEGRISTEIVNVSTDTRELKHIKLSLFEDQYETYQQAITDYREENQGMVDGASDSAIVYAIMQDWLGSRSGRIPSLDEDIENFQARHGVEIQVVPRVRKA